MATAEDPQRADNEVFLRGKLADTPVVRDLPSGDVLASFRLTVARTPSQRGRVDSLECVAVRARPRGVLERARPGEILEVRGSLQRRFWRGPTGPASRYAVAVETIRRVRSGPTTTPAVDGGVRSRRRADA